MTKNFLRSLVIAALACAGATALHAQTVLELSYPANAPGAVPCLYTTNAQGISANPQNGHLQATGDFATTGCGSSLPLPVIVGGPSSWQFPNPWAVNQPAAVQWAAANAAFCTYGGSAATGWPSGTNACSGAACETLNNVTLIPTSAAQYQFSLTCTNSSGSVTSTSNPVTVAANPPIITQGPSTWNVLPWEAGQTRNVQWSATNAANCSFTPTTLPSGVTIGDFLSGGVTSCSTQATCSSSNNLILNASVAGTYGVTLTCNGVGGGSTTSTSNWDVTQSSGGTCMQPASGWNRLQTAEIFNFGAYQSAGFHDVTQFDSIWGRNYSEGGYPIIAQWPGVGQQFVMPKIGNNQFVAAKFHTPASGQHGHTFKIDGTSFNLSGGGSNATMARVSATVSTACGDFNSASTNIPALCKWNQQGGFDAIAIWSGYPSGQFCRLQPDTDYYLNIIYAPLLPAPTVFNGIGGPGVVMWQNTGVQQPYSGESQGGSSDPPSFMAANLPPGQRRVGTRCLVAGR